MKCCKMFVMLLCVGILAISPLHNVGAKEMTILVQEPYGLDMSSATAKAFDDLLRDYEKAHPDVKIEYLSPPGGIHDNATYNPWVTARMLAKDAPDIMNLHQGLVTQFYGQGWFMPLDDMLKMDDPYADGQAWGATLDQGMVNFFTMNDGHSYGVPVDGVGVAVFYNKSMFQKAGISGEPTTWPEFIEVCQKLKAAGFVAWNGGNGVKARMALHWLTTPLLGQMMQTEELQALRKQIDLNGDGSLVNPEYAIAFREGMWPNWDAYTDSLKIYKQLTEFMPAGWEGDVPNFDTNFASGAVTMSIEGSWTVPALIEMGLDFEFGVFQVPLLTSAETQFASGQLCRHTGPWGYSLGLPGYLERDPKRLAIVQDLVMFLTSSESMQKIADASTSYLPFVKGVSAGGNQAELMAIFSNPDAVPIVDVPSWVSLSYDQEGAEAADGMIAIEGEFMAGKITIEEAVEKAKQAIEGSVQRQVEMNPDFLKK